MHPRWLNRGVAGIGVASFLSDVSHEVPTALRPSLLTTTLGAPAAALGTIEGIADGVAGAAKLAGGALADDPGRRRVTAMGGYTATAVLSALIGAATAVWQVGVLRARSPRSSASLSPAPASRCSRRCSRFRGRARAPSETAQGAAVALLAPPALVGSAFGALATIRSFANLTASAVAGALWTLVSRARPSSTWQAGRL